MKKFLKIVFVCLFLLIPVSAVGDDDLHTGWDILLKKHVQNGKVDYQGFKQDETLLDGYLKQLDLSNVTGMSRDEQLALYINGYNAYTIKLILDHFEDGKPVRSIKDIGGLFTSPWSIEFAGVGGRVLSLDGIEHEIIRPLFQDYRIHFAVNCASRGCPPLISEAYLPSTLSAQLDQVSKEFVNSNTSNYLKGNVLYVSKIFKWYGEDFESEIEAVFLKYGDPSLIEKIKEVPSGKLKIKYLDYDWSLNKK